MIQCETHAHPPLTWRRAEFEVAVRQGGTPSVRGHVCARFTAHKIDTAWSLSERSSGRRIAVVPRLCDAKEVARSIAVFWDDEGVRKPDSASSLQVVMRGLLLRRGHATPRSRAALLALCRAQSTIVCEVAIQAKLEREHGPVYVADVTRAQLVEYVAHRAWRGGGDTYLVRGRFVSVEALISLPAGMSARRIEDALRGLASVLGFDYDEMVRAVRAECGGEG